MEQLLFRLEWEQLDQRDRQLAAENMEMAQLQSSPEVRAARNRKKLSDLRHCTAALQDELKLKRELEAQRKRHAKAAVALKEANLTTEERRERDADTQRFQMLFSRICPESHPDWRQRADDEFQSRYSKR
jgi:hypothetical protein